MSKVKTNKIQHVDATGTNTNIELDSSRNVTCKNNLTVDGTLTADLANDSIDSEHYVADSIDTEHYAPNSVDLAAMAGIVRGKLIVGDSNGDPSYLTAGSNDNVLTMDANGDVGWEAPAAGGAALTGSTNNTICTVTGSSAIQGEANLTFDGSNFGIGTTNVLPGYTDSNNGAWFSTSGQFCIAAPGNAVFIGRNGSTGTLVMFRDDGGGIGQIETNGSTVSYNSNSDYRLKENKVNLTGGITRLKNLKPYRFNFKSTPSITQDGFYAHEVQEVVPIAATGTKDQVITQADLDSGQYVEGSVALNDVVPQCIDHSQLVPLLVAALQEAVARIETLEAAG